MVACVIKNGESTSIVNIPTVDYQDFYKAVIELLKDKPHCHCINYFAYRNSYDLKFIICIANDDSGEIQLLSHTIIYSAQIELMSLSKEIFALHFFEREISENFGIIFTNHPWPKPIRYAFDRADKEKNIYNYPFFKIEGEAIHEVGVGPIHAGVIEPGHFRFQCNGEYVHHLEIQLGWQHRGIEQLFIKKNKLIQRNILAESIAGDTVVGHTLAFVFNMESLYEIKESKKLSLVRTLALELERIAVHVGDLSALCTDIAYQLGYNVFGALRTPVINHFQLWCGNRFAKGLIRTGYSGYEFTEELSIKFQKMLEEFEIKYIEMAEEMFSLPSVMSRFEKTGETTLEQMQLIGAVGMAARNAGLKRDSRTTHPFAYFKNEKFETETLPSGDVYARAKLRDLEIKSSLKIVKNIIKELNTKKEEIINQRIDLEDKKMLPNTISVSITEGWRGEICHCAITNSESELIHYKIKDPSVHNWLALALALRENEISDFPVNNKSYDLSYCGHDL
ncbi:MAG: NADH dehydrogenase subunit [Cytophagales bacterium]|nr:MAG: NADH dehydrogenase subunit [Cytophagales bacterium]